MKRTAEEVYDAYVARKNAYGERNDAVASYRQLFDGDHWDEPLSSEEQKTEDTFQLVVNYCRSTVLHFAGALASAPRFRVPRPSGNDSALRLKAEVRERWLAGLHDALIRAWMDVEMDAAKVGFGVLQVIENPDEEMGVPFIFRSIDPVLFYPCYRTWYRPDDFLYVIREEPGRLIEDLEDTYEVTLQATDMEEGTEGTCTVIEYWDKDHYYLVALTHRDVTETVGGQEFTTTETVYETLEGGKHGLPRIPFFVLQNIRNAHEDPTYEGSLSDVDAVSEMNKHYDWLLSSHADEILVQIHRPIAYKSEDHELPAHELVAKPGAVWKLGADEDATPVVWPAEPEAVQHHFRLTRDAINDMSFIPATAQGELPAGVSGTSMGIANTPLQRILELKKPRRIEVLKAVARLLLQLAEKSDKPIATWCTMPGNERRETKITREFIGGDYYTDIRWRNMLPRDEIAYEAHQAYLWKTGAQTLPRTLDKLGVEWVEAEMEQLMEEYIDPRINPERAMQYASAQMALKQLEKMGEEQQAPQPGVPGQPGEGFTPSAVPPQQEGLAPGPARGQLPVQPPAPPFQQMGQEQRLTPFAPREQFGAGALPLRPPGPGINIGGQ